MAEGLRKIASRLGGRQLAWAVNLLLLLLLAQTIMGALGQRKASTVVHNPVQPARPAAPQHGPSAQQLAQQIANWHLFGNAGLVAVSKGPTVAPETKLNLLLRGVIASPEQVNAVAIVADGNKAEDKAYGIGDSLPGGAEVKEIYSDRVIIEYRGRAETLTLRRKLLSNEEFTIKN
ncbi:type II secretion system protein N [Sulfuriflexus mobilis]|uniref:type II secretion system protein N n=1 Tax=Sulfuriflexus mobilis TaxID=1811807 RepID=UPI000F81D90E|nr:type II secretion system protein N [Sulfuriflexus mobilis]